MASRECRHIKTNGRRCCSPRLTGRDLCYFHTRLFQRAMKPSSKPAHLSLSPPWTPSAWAANPIELNLPALEDRESIQVPSLSWSPRSQTTASNPSAPPSSSTASS